MIFLIATRFLLKGVSSGFFSYFLLPVYTVILFALLAYYSFLVVAVFSINDLKNFRQDCVPPPIPGCPSDAPSPSEAMVCTPSTSRPM